MIVRVWRGWTTRANADAYESLLRKEVLPGIQARHIEGLRRIEFARREDGARVEFLTVMLFENLAAVHTFAGDDWQRAVVPPHAQQLLTEYDVRSLHYDLCATIEP